MTSKNGTVKTVQRVETSAYVDNLPHWTTEQAIVELLQNVLDVAKTSECAYAVEHSGTLDGTLVVRDAGPGLRKEHLLWGCGDKANDGSAAGEYAEGLKQALLVFAREHKSVIVKSRHLSLSLSIESHSVLGKDVLVYYLSEGDYYPGTMISVSGIDVMDLSKAKSRFAAFLVIPWLVPGVISDYVARKDEDRSVFVNGLKIGTSPTALTYHLTGAAAKELKNRDRNVVDSSKFRNLLPHVLHENATEAVWTRLLQTMTDPKEGYRALESGLDVPYKLRASDAASKAFVALFGDKVVWDSYNVNTAFLRYLGYTVVSLGYGWRNYFSGCVQDAGQIAKESAQLERTDVKLTRAEKAFVSKVMRYLVYRGFSTDYTLKIADALKSSAGKDASGLWIAADRTIWIARCQLSSRQAFISTYLHELAHAESGDEDTTAGFEAKLTQYLGQLAQ